MAATCTVIPIATEGDFNDHTSNLPADCLAVIYFHAPWAEPCKQMGTILSTLASTYPATNPQRIAFLSLDAEEVSEVSETYDVTQVPLVVLQKNGQVVDSVTGTDASKVRNAVEQHAGAPAAGSASGSSLPPAQQVTRPPPSENEPKSQEENGDAGLAKYAPGPSDPATAPEFSGAEIDGATKEELHSRLGELVKAAPVMLFMKGTPSAPQCGFSRQTVSLLREKGVRYGFFNILADDEVRQGLKEYSEWPTFPQVYVGGELVGGLDIVSGIRKHVVASTQLTTDSSSRKSSRTTTSSFRTTWFQSSVTLAAQLLPMLRLNLRRNARYYMNAMNIEKRQYIIHRISIRQYDIIPQQVSPSSHAGSGGSEVGRCSVQTSTYVASHFVGNFCFGFKSTQ
jgi:Grx4 family monothiol glutaredoxin